MHNTLFETDPYRLLLLLGCLPLNQGSAALVFYLNLPRFIRVDSIIPVSPCSSLPGHSTSISFSQLIPCPSVVPSKVPASYNTISFLQRAYVILPLLSQLFYYASDSNFRPLRHFLLPSLPGSPRHLCTKCLQSWLCPSIWTIWYYKINHKLSNTKPHRFGTEDKDSAAHLYI